MDRRRLAGMHSRLQAGSAPLRRAYNHRLAGFLTGLSKLLSSEFHCLQIEPMRATVLSVLLVMVAASSAQAQTAPRIFYPAAAQTQGIGGEATVECLVGDNGRLACETIEEAPANMGFGAAALRMCEDLRVAPRTRDGVSTAGGRLRRTFVFEPGPPPTVTSR